MERDVSAGQRRIFSRAKNQFIGGRGFTEAEVNGARKLAIVNQTFVRKYLTNENPIGRQVRIAQLAEFEDAVKEPTFEIIGLVADAKTGDCKIRPSRRFGYRTR